MAQPIVRSKSSRRPRTCRISVPLNPIAGAAMLDAATDIALPIRTIVLRALHAAGVFVAPDQLCRPTRNCQRMAGRRRSKTSGYCVSVILPPRTFASLKKLARKRRATIVQLVRIALREAGIPVWDEEILGDLRRTGLRRSRTHYATRTSFSTPSKTEI